LIDCLIIFNLLLFTGTDTVSIEHSSVKPASAYYSDDDLDSSIKNIEIIDKKSGYFILDKYFIKSFLGLFEFKTTLRASYCVWSLIEMNNGNIPSGVDNDEIEIWNTKTYLCIATLKGHNNGVSSLIQLKNGNVVSASWDITIKIWDIKSMHEHINRAQSLG
jgi:WD40 repeat protein